ncbi:MAG: GNAT family N-acetyltransferase [Candidatus Micrarchaeota archaeon]|nr:GNAT family N-acetyltransferase [Candidatus Micrarchaeota archaeon]
MERAKLEQLIKPSLEPGRFKEFGETVPVNFRLVERRLRVSNRDGELVGAFKTWLGGERLLEFRRLKAKKGVYLRVIDATGKPAKIAVFGSTSDPKKKEFYVYHRSVHPSYRGLGIASTALNLIENHYFSRGSKKAVFGTAKKSTLVFLLHRGYKPLANKSYVAQVRRNPQRFQEDLTHSIELEKTRR